MAVNKNRQLCIGILAHVDAGKTTLSEAMLYLSGAIRSLGRVDHGDTALDTHALERERGISIFSSQACFSRGGTDFTLLDTPGHVDFSAEMERTLDVIDCAVLVISGSDGVQAHTETLWQLLERYKVPVFIFVTKMDLAAADKAALMEDMRRNLSSSVFDLSGADPEELALLSEEALEKYSRTGALDDGDINAMIASRQLFPCAFGSGLKLEGVEDFLGLLERRAPVRYFPEDDFGARVFKISYDEKGRRLSHLRLTGGSLRLRQSLKYTGSDGKGYDEKISALYLYSGASPAAAGEAAAGQVCLVSGLGRSFAGQGLGFEPDAPSPALQPALSYRLRLPENVDPREAMPKLKLLQEEDPLLRIIWNSRLSEIDALFMGQVQTEVLKSVIASRFGMEVEIDHGRIMYRETIAEAVEGAGHFEPLRHYAEVHLLLAPLEPGRGLEFESDCGEDQLDLNWQRLILTHLAEREHPGVLTGSPITDMRITLTAGRAHLKHTEGGDFRQATYRALRQGLMKAKNVLLEPYYSFRLQVPIAQTGRAISDIRAMNGSFESRPGQDCTILEGTAPVAAMRDYVSVLASYTSGRGRLSCRMAGYMPCHDQERIVSELGYDPEADVENTPDSVFCAHGAGFNVKWHMADEYMHLSTGLGRDGERKAPRLRMSNLDIDEKELEAIMDREFGPIKRPMYTSPLASGGQSRRGAQRKREYLVVDGYNVIFAWDELKAMAADSLDAARHRLEEIMVSYRGFTGAELVLVFDGYAVKGNQGEKFDYHGIHVVYTKENESADLYIEKLLHDIGRNYSVRVVTSDNLIRLSAAGSGILRTSAREFGNETDWVFSQIGDILRRSNYGAHTTKIDFKGKI